MKMVLVAFFLFCYVSLSAEPITPISLHVDDVDIQKAKLGKELFFDPILSRDGSVACVNCHVLNDGGDDGLKVSFGIEGKKGSINSPTVLNARYNLAQFWDGRAKDLKEQAKGPIENPVEMGHDFKNLVKKLKNTPYNEKFKKIYKDGITKDNITDALAEYEKTLITPNSPFDKFLRGDKNAISKKAKEGYKLFKSMGCVACHNGVNIGGNTYARFGIFDEYEKKDLGRYSVTKDPDDVGVFKVPTLRNITKTAPYFHDGRFDRLEDAVSAMMNFQLGLEADKEKVKSIIEFLKTLDGEIYDFENN
jgi:cytochrome c peroxidase